MPVSGRVIHDLLRKLKLYLLISKCPDLKIAFAIAAWGRPRWSTAKQRTRSNNSQDPISGRLNGRGRRAPIGLRRPWPRTPRSNCANC